MFLRFAGLTDIFKDLKQTIIPSIRKEFCYFFADKVFFMKIIDSLGRFVEVNKHKILSVVNRLIDSHTAFDVIKQLEILFSTFFYFLMCFYLLCNILKTCINLIRFVFSLMILGDGIDFDPMVLFLQRMIDPHDFTKYGLTCF